MTPPMNARKGTPDQVRAVAYIRQSKRREDDSRTSPEAQRAKCEALIAAKGWHHAGTFADIGVSGWDPEVIRPEFEAMMEAARNGEIDAVVVFMLSRLTRRGALEAMRIQEELSKHGVLLVSVEEPYLDTSTPMGVAIFGLIAALAQQESDMKSAYVTATKETLRKAGSHVSGMAPYGFTTERITRDGLSVVQLVPDGVEAPVVRRMVDDAMNGTSASAIAAKLTEEGVPTKTDRLGDAGKARLKARHARGTSKPLERTPWHSTTVFRILRDPRLAGYAITGQGRKAEILYVDGAPLMAHKPIIPAETWWELQDILNGRSTVPRREKRSVPTLLAGLRILRCGVCGANMVGDTRNGKPYYRCHRPRGAVAGHGGLAVSRDVVDDIVARRVWMRLAALDPADPADARLLTEAAKRFAAQRDTSEHKAELAAARAELEHVRAARRNLQADREAGLYDDETGQAMYRESALRLRDQEATVTARVADLEAADDDAVSIPAEWTEPGEDPIGPGSLWESWDLTEQRAFLALFVDAVDIAKAAGRGPRANTEGRVSIRWAGEAAADGKDGDDV